MEDSGTVRQYESQVIGLTTGVKNTMLANSKVAYKNVLDRQESVLEASFSVKTVAVCQEIIYLCVKAVE